MEYMLRALPLKTPSLLSWVLGQSPNANYFMNKYAS